MGAHLSGHLWGSERAGRTSPKPLSLRCIFYKGTTARAGSHLSLSVCLGLSRCWVSVPGTAWPTAVTPRFWRGPVSAQLPACLPVSHWDKLPATGQDSGCRVSSPWHPQGGGSKGGARKEPPGLWRLPSGPACLLALLVRSGSLSMQGIWSSSPTKNQLSPHWSSLAPEEREMCSRACHKAPRFQALLCCTEGGI